MTESQPKFFGIDIDSTFYVDDIEKMQNNIDAFKLLKNKNIMPFLCTSRYFGSAMGLLGNELCKKIGYNGYPGVYSNGCCVFDEHGNMIFLKKFSRKFLDRYLKFIKDNRMEDKVVFISPYISFMIIEPHEEIKHNIQIKNMHKPEIMSLEDVYRFDIVCVRNIVTKDKIMDFENGKDCVFHLYGNVVTLSPPGITKVDGIIHLLTHFKAKPSECAYIGDSENDIEALKYFGLSFAVNNARDEVKEKAKWVVDLNYDQGAFAKVVELICAKSAPISQFTKPDTLPKFFGIDIDGTFYIEDADMMKKNVEAFKLLKNKNIKPFFCTGRHYLCNQKLLGNNFAQETGYNGYPGIYANGAVVYDSDGKVLHIEKFTTEFLDKFEQYVKNNHFEDKVMYYTDDNVYCVGTYFSEGLDLLRKLKSLEPTEITKEELKNKNIISLVFPGDDVNITGLNKGTDYVVKYPNPGVAFVTPGSCTKKRALEELFKYLNTDENQCAYIGDCDNDIESLEYCTLSFVVNNAKNEVKQKAKWVVDLNYNQGAFAKVVELLFKEQTVTSN